ncbi:unnamed protein product [Closterium sp. Yama58-4]|nr:unnamed protein product [Closterium sp. Yama58-4]
MASDRRLTQSLRSSSNPQAARNASSTTRNAAPDPTVTAELPPPSFHVDVAIAGGGLAGLALAAGLQWRGVEAAVFEAAPAVLRSNNSTGTILVMFPNGTKALEGLKPGLGDAVIACGSSITKVQSVFQELSADIVDFEPARASTSCGPCSSGSGTNDAAMKGTSENRDGWVMRDVAPRGQIVVEWARAQEVLASSLMRPESIMHGHRVVAYHPVVAGIPIDSRSGEMESSNAAGIEGEVEAVDMVLEVVGSNPKTSANDCSFAVAEGAETADEVGAVEQQRQLVVVRAKILVAADGLRSAVRNQMIGDSPRYLAQIGWNALVPNPLTARVHQQQDRTFFYFKDEVQADDPDGQLVSELQLTPFGGFGKPGVKDRLMCHISKNIADPSGHDTWHTMLQVVTTTDPGSIYERWMMDRPPPNDSWSDSNCGSRVVLMGDAAHAMHPGPGQGAHTAFEDAHQLSLCLAEIKDKLTEPAAVAAVVREYEARRIDRCVKVHAYATAAHWYGQEGKFVKEDVF